MGVKIFDIVPIKEISLQDLANKVIVIDGNLALYQFLSSIRQMDGSLLTDSQGRATSHLSGLFSRTVRLSSQGIRLCFVFDGKAPELKRKERERRKALKEEAEIMYQKALASKDIELMKKYASRTSKLTGDMIEESKELIRALGIPVVQAPSEGEAQAALMVRNKDAYAVGSQDGDCFMYGAPRLVKNLTVTSRKKLPGKLAYSKITPELIQLDDVLNTLAIDHEQLIVLSMLIGTDFNVGGIKGIGPKTALKLVKKYGADFDALFKDAKWDDFFDYGWEEVFNLIKNIPATKDYRIKWDNVDENKVKEILVEQHDFSADRVESTLSKLSEQEDKKKQKGLGDWL